MDEQTAGDSRIGEQNSVETSYLLPADFALPPAMTNEKFRNADLAMLRGGARIVHFDNCDFTDALDLQFWTDSPVVVFRKCRFHGAVEGSKREFAGAVFFVDCVFENSITLAEASFARGLAVAFCRVNMSVRPGLVDKPLPLADFDDAPHRSRCAWWPGLRVTGMLRLDRSIFEGSLNLAEARIDGPLLMRGVRIGDGVRGNGRPRGRLHLRQVQVASDVNLGPHVPARKFWRARRSVIGGSVVLAAAKIEGRLDLRGAKLGGRLHMPHAHVRDRLDAEVWRSHADTDATAPLITDEEAEDLNVADAELEKKSRLIPTEIGQRRGVAVRLADAEIGHGVWLDGAQLAGQLNAKNARIGGDFYFRKPKHYATREYEERVGTATITLPRSDPMDPDPTDPASITEAIRFTGAKIRGSLDFRLAMFDGTLNIENAHIAGDLHLLKARVRRVDDPRSGRVRLHASQIERLLDFRGAHFDGKVEAHLIDVGGDLKCCADVDPRLGPDESACFSAGADFSESKVNGMISLDAVGISGELDLSGVRGESLTLRVEKGNDNVPELINVRDAVFRTVHLSGDHCPIELKPFFELRGLTFEQLDVVDLHADPSKLEKQETITARWRWRLYHLHLPEPWELALGFIVTTWGAMTLWSDRAAGNDAFAMTSAVTWLHWGITLAGLRLLPRVWLASAGGRVGITIFIMVTIALATFLAWVATDYPNPERVGSSLIMSIAMLGMAANAMRQEWRSAGSMSQRSKSYPSRERLFLAQMVEMDSSLYFRTEAWLRNHGRNEEANRIYVQRRTREIESGVSSWFLNALRARRALRAARRGESRRDDLSRWRQAVCRMGRWGRPAIVHPQLICEAAQRNRNTRELRQSAVREFWRRVLRTPQRLMEFLIFMSVGDGGRVAPAVVLWLTTLIFSTCCIFSDPNSVERPATFLAVREFNPERKVNPAHKGQGKHPAGPYWQESMGDARYAHHGWGARDSFWVALNAQMPLASFAARENWTPSHQSVAFFVALAAQFDRGGRLHWLEDFVPHSRISIPRYDTWAGIMQLWGWLSVPIILASLTGLLKRRPMEMDGEAKRERE